MHVANSVLNQGYQPFGAFFRIEKAVAAEGEDGDWIVEGPLSESGADLQGEKMAQGQWGQSGLRKGLQTLMTLGAVVDWEHLYERLRDPAAIIGKGIELFDAPHPKTGEVVPWLRVRLLKGQPLAQKAWNLLQAGGTLGFSVAGAAIKRAGTQILETLITTVAITAVPVVARNAGTLQVAKAIQQATAAGQDFGDLYLPFMAERYGEMPGEPCAKALQATGDLRHPGPGVDAATVEDLGAETLATPEGDAPDAKRKKLKLKAGSKAVRKALALQMHQALQQAFAA